MPDKVAIIGSGLIGRCWASLFLRAGMQVCLYDVNLEQIDAALSGIREQLETLGKQGLLGGEEGGEDAKVRECVGRMSGVCELEEALQGAVHVQECIPEDLDLKKSLFHTLDQILAQMKGEDKKKEGGCWVDKVVLASSSSCLKASLFTESLTHRSQCLVAHPVNPPHYIPLVELVPAPWTSQEVTARTRGLMQRIGQAPVVLLKEVDGFVLNRLQYAVLMEAWKLVEDGVCTPEDVDTAVSQGLGLRWSFMGPFETIDLNAPGGVRDYCERYGKGITSVYSTMTEAREFSGPTVDTLEESLRASVGEKRLEERKKWRDARLAHLAVHKLTEEKRDKWKS
eukprot:Nk52_evm10s1569 gene=Nk52_evmTU10s1569